MIHKTNVRDEIGSLIEVAQNIPSNTEPGRAGCFVTYAQGVKTADTLGFTTLAVGKIPSDKRSKYFELSREKGTRLASQILRGEDRIASSETRVPENNMWGGAIYFPETDSILSVSGFTEIVDEAISATGGLRLENPLETGQYINRLVGTLENPAIPEMLQALRG